MQQRRVRLRRLAPALAVALLAAGCGARVTQAQRESLVGAGSGGGVAAAAGSPQQQQDGAVSSATPTGVTVAPGQSPTAAPAAAKTGAVAAAASSAGAPTATPASVPGGNGGATDVGVTGDSLTIGTLSTLSGPAPGLFAGATIGTEAAVAYQNSLGGVYGRKLKVDARDDQFDAGQNRSQTLDLIGKTFALVGGFTIYDDGAIPEIEKAGVPDVALSATAMGDSPMNFAVSPARRGAPTGPFDLFKAKFPDSIGAVGALYSDIPAAKESFLNTKNAAESLGYKFVYERSYQPTESDFTADVVAMRQAGVRLVVTSADVKTIARLVTAMQQQSFKPDAFVSFATAYDGSFVPLAGSAADGVYVVLTSAMFMGEDAGFNPEVQLMDQWLQKVKPGYKPDVFTAYGWASTRLFMKALQDAGPQATRASTLAALRKIDSWNGYGMFPDAGPASKRPSVCYIAAQVQNGHFARWESPPPGFNCQNSRFVFRQ